MTYKQIVEEVTEACASLPVEANYAEVFEILLYEVLRDHREAISDDTDRAERTEADTPTDN